MIKSIIALVGGFAIMAFLLLALTVVAASVLPGQAGTGARAFLVARFLNSAASALVGGYAAAALAPNKPFVHAAGLAIMILAMGLSELATPHTGDPTWYPAALALASPVFALAGGALRRPRPATIAREQAT